MIEERRSSGEMSQTVLHISVSVHTFICTSKCSTAIHGLWKPVNSQDISHFLMSAGMFQKGIYIDTDSHSLSMNMGVFITAKKKLLQRLNFLAVMFGLKLIKDGSTPSDSSKNQARREVPVGSSASKQQQQKGQITLSPLPIPWQHINTAELTGTVVYEGGN